MDESERRMAQNEVLFREVNERVDDLAEGVAAGHAEYLCECANQLCTFRVPLTPTEYASVRADGKQFVVLPDHWTPEIETLVLRDERYWVVRKTGEAGAYVEATDPRSRPRSD
jgi:AraC-like DNA-binding protein